MKAERNPRLARTNDDDLLIPQFLKGEAELERAG
jgi:hypothetical protein